MLILNKAKASNDAGLKLQTALFFYGWLSVMSARADMPNMVEHSSPTHPHTHPLFTFFAYEGPYKKEGELNCLISDKGLEQVPLDSCKATLVESKTNIWSWILIQYILLKCYFTVSAILNTVIKRKPARVP